MGNNLWAALMTALVLAVISLPAQSMADHTLPEDQIVEETAAQPPQLGPEETVMPETAPLPPGLPDAQMLVNRSNTLPADFMPQDLTPIKGFVRSNGNILLRADAAQALREMLAALKAAGIKDIYANSGYRSYGRQQELYAAKVASYRKAGYSEAEAQAARWVAPPGASEHQSGLAVDFSTSSTGYDLVEAFANTAAGRWLAAHCGEYGFILRYAAEKEPLTGVAAEPWHFRYVGADHAFYIRQHDLCLEEYHALLSGESPLNFTNASGEKRAVYYSETVAGLPGKLLALSRAGYGSAYSIVTLKPPLYDALGHWGEPYIFRLHALGIVNGYEDGSFRPNAGVSRGEFITALSRLPIDIFAEEPPANSGQEDFAQYLLNSVILPYEDADPAKYYYQPLQRCYRVALAQALDILLIDEQGVGHLLFEAGRPLARGEAALLLARTLDAQDFILPGALSYSDVPPLAGQLFSSVEFLSARGVFAGDSDGLFHPERGVSRAEMSAMLCRLLDVALQEAALQKEAAQEDPADQEVEEDETKIKANDPIR